MTQTVPDSIVEKLQMLKAKADSAKSIGELQEAEIFAAKVQELLLKYKLPLYPHLKVIISSATININEFKETFEKGGISVGIIDLSEILKEEKNCCVHYWKQEGIEGCDCWLCQNAGKREKFWEDKESLF